MSWNLLQISDALDIEFGSALAERVPVIGWKPERLALHLGQRPAVQANTDDPPLTIRTFPLQRGFSRWPVSELSGTGRRVHDHLMRHQGQDEEQVLICTSPYFAEVAERWEGPVVYWLTDRIEFYQGERRSQIHSLDSRLCAAATIVCPNSLRLAEYLQDAAACPQEKLLVLPNATRQSNLLPETAASPSALPEDLAHLPRPIAGIIGNMAGNVDWIFLHSLLQASLFLHWAFVGPTSMAIKNTAQAEARDAVMCMKNACFVGRKPYGVLAAYARAFDVAVLPYLLCEPTYSGSSTRFYEHLAAGRPMLATRGFEELLHKEPMLKLVDNSEEGAAWLSELRDKGFDDGLTRQRLLESRNNTWQCRAEQLVNALHNKLRFSGEVLAHRDHLPFVDRLGSATTTNRFGADPK